MHLINEKDTVFENWRSTSQSPSHHFFLCVKNRFKCWKPAHTSVVMLEGAFSAGNQLLGNHHFTVFFVAICSPMPEINKRVALNLSDMKSCLGFGV